MDLLARLRTLEGRGDEEAPDYSAAVDARDAAAPPELTGSTGATLPTDADRLAQLTGIDLDDEQNMLESGLEDPILKEHMNEARARLRAHEKAQANLPDPDSLINDYIDLRRQLSALVTGLTDLVLAGNTQVSTARRSHSDLEDLRNGKTPPGYRKGEELSRLSSKIAGTASALEEYVARMNVTKEIIHNFRREFERVVTGFQRHGGLFD